MLFLNRKLRTRLDLLKPSLARTVNQSQEAQQLRCQERSKSREFCAGDSVLVLDYRKGEKWRPGVIMSRTGPVSYIVNVDAAGSWKPHVDQMLRRGVPSSDTSIEPVVPVCSANSQAHSLLENISEETNDLVDVITDSPGSGNINTAPSETVQTRETLKRYPTRLNRPPDRYQAS